MAASTAALEMDVAKLQNYIEAMQTKMTATLGRFDDAKNGCTAIEDEVVNEVYTVSLTSYNPFPRFPARVIILVTALVQPSIICKPLKHLRCALYKNVLVSMSLAALSVPYIFLNQSGN